MMLRNKRSPKGVSFKDGFSVTTRTAISGQVVSETGQIQRWRVQFCAPSSVTVGVPGRDLSECLSAFYLFDKADSLRFSWNSASLAQNSVSCRFRNRTLETVIE